jgi:hypothetical protein
VTTHRWRRWLWLAPGPDRLVLAIALIVRLAGTAMVAAALPLVWSHLAHPAWSAALAAALTAENAVAAVLSRRWGRLDPRLLALDVPAGVAAIPLGLWAAGMVYSWTVYVYPYTVLLAFTLGLAARRATVALVSGAVWAVTYTVATTTIGHTAPVAAALATPGYLVNALVGWLSARQLYVRSRQLHVTRAAAVSQAGALGAARERARHARALHDRVLQTVEALARDSTVADPALRARVVEQAAWLRTFIETGGLDQATDLAAALAATTRQVADDGVDVQLNDASLRRAIAARDPVLTGLDAAGRDVVVNLAHQAIRLVATNAPAGIVVHADRPAEGILISVLATGADTPLSPTATAALVAQVDRAGGRLTVEPGPYLELWLPDWLPTGTLPP